MTRRARVAAIAGAVVLVGVAGPFLLRRIPFFRIRRVEAVGVRYLDPDSVIAALGLGPRQNLFDPLGAARERVERMPGVVQVTLDRRPPGTLRVTVVERRPTALVSGRERMIALDCEAHPLPYDPAASGLDLPLVSRADTALLRTLCQVRAADSALYQEVEVARPAGDGAVTLDLGQQRVLLRSVPTTDEILAVGAVRRHLAAAGRDVAELDARFAGWVVARPERS